MPNKTTPCKWCGTPTRMLGTRECDAHWELRHRIEGEPAMAARMLGELAPAESSCDDVDNWKNEL